MHGTTRHDLIPSTLLPCCFSVILKVWAKWPNVDFICIVQFYRYLKPIWPVGDNSIYEYNILPQKVTLVIILASVLLSVSASALQSACHNVTVLEMMWWECTYFKYVIMCYSFIKVHIFLCYFLCVFFEVIDLYLKALYSCCLELTQSNTQWLWEP